MAKADKEIGFTVGDQERMVSMEGLLRGIDEKLDKLPCQHEPPLCTQEPRLKSLETSRKRWYTGIVTALIGIVVTGVGVIIRSLFN